MRLSPDGSCYVWGLGQAEQRREIVVRGPVATGLYFGFDTFIANDFERGECDRAEALRRSHSGDVPVLPEPHPGARVSAAFRAFIKLGREVMGPV